jgi:hypothetical protein
MEYPAFINGSYQSQSYAADNERTVNFFLELMESGGSATRAALYPTPGFSQFGPTPDENPVRGAWFGAGRLLVAVGGVLEERTADGVRISRGSIANDNTPVTFETNGDGGGEVFFSSAGVGYLFTLATNVLTTVVQDVDFAGYLDGFFLGLDVDTSTFKISEFYTGGTWDPTQIAQRNVASDTWVAMWVNNREIWLFGSLTTEVWYNNGSAPFPFGPIDNAFIEHGIAAPRSVASLDGRVVWLAANENGSGIVRLSEGWNGIRISNHAIEYAMQNYSTISDAIGWSYEQYGHEFYILEFPTAGKTWVYDALTKIWCERSSWDETLGIETAWRARWHVKAFEKHIVGDRLTGRLFEMSDRFFYDVDGNLIRRVRRAPHMGNELRRIKYAEFKLDLQPGVGLSTGQGSDPMVMMRYSDDGGKTWSPEFWRSAGLVGEHDAVVQWNALGQARRRVFEVIFTDPVPWRILNAYVRLGSLNAIV